ncbi:MAG TPA: trypsin-like serine protease [Polyangia bacterium]|nr:trypsin-like serine protease [Polyangia bacterium]
MKTSLIRPSLASLIVLSTLAAVGCGSEPPPEEVAVAPAAAVSRALSTSAATKTVTPVAPAPATTPPANSDLQTLHPWDVHITGTGSLDCRGILIHPSWVLTAAHCIGPIAGTVSYSRTDPTTGAVSSDSRSFDVNGPHRGMFVNPGYVADGNFGQPQNDIALIRLASPFNIDRNIQTAGLPRAPANPGRTGTMGTNNHVTMPPGYTAVVRAPQLATADCTAPAGFICIDPPAGSLCSGDSGSGFTEVLNGRAQVIGVASNISNFDSSTGCILSGGQAQLSDVYQYESWILSTMGMSSLNQVGGHVQLRASSAVNGGELRLTCTATQAVVDVTTSVPGGEIGMDCDDVAVVCIAPSTSSLTGFSETTTAANGSVTTQSLPFLSAFTAIYADPGATFQEYTCGFNNGLFTAVSTVATATVMLAQ